MVFWPAKAQHTFPEIVGEFLKQPLPLGLSADAKSIVFSLWLIALSALESVLLLFLL